MLGIRTNISYLIAILQHPRFLSGDVDTGFLATERELLLGKLASADLPLAALAAAAFHSQRAASETSGSDIASRPVHDPFSTVGGWGQS